MNRKTGTTLAGPLFLAAVLFLFFWPLWLLGYRFPKGSGDLWGLWYPVWSYVAEWVHRGVFPLWDTRMMGGDPIVADTQYGLFNPLNWPLFLTYPIPSGLVLLRGAMPLWLAGVGLYLYLRYSPLWGVGRTSALIGATAYMLSDPLIAHLGNPPFNDAMAWLPWILLGVDWASLRTRAVPLAALAVALMLVSGHGQISLYGAMVTALYALWRVLEGGWRWGGRRLVRLAMAGLLGIALAAPALLPTLERFPFTERAGMPQEARGGLEFSPQALIDTIAPEFHGRGVDHSWLGWARTETAYAGALALYLALFGLMGNLHRRRTWLWVGLGVLAYLFALGRRGPLYPLLADLPFFAESWKTSRAIFILPLALAVLAAQGADSLPRSRRGLLFLWGIILLAGGLLIVIEAPRWVRVVPDGSPRYRALTGLRFAALLAGGSVLLGWAASRGKLWGRAGWALLLVAELVALGALVETEPSPRPTTTPAPAIAFLKADPGWFRVDVAVAARGLWSPVLLRTEGFEAPQPAGNALELREFNILYWRIPSAVHPAYRMLGVKYLLVPKGAPPGGEGIWPVFVNDPTVDVHLHTLALPRVWLVYRTEVVENYGEALERVLDEHFRPEEVAVLQNGPRLDGNGQGKIEVGYYGPNDIVLHVETDAAALLILSDTFYPGWKATVDGEPTPIYRTNAVFRGVPVPPGRHRIAMHFRPSSLRVGLGTAAMGGMLCLFLGIIGRRLR